MCAEWIPDAAASNCQPDVESCSDESSIPGSCYVTMTRADPVSMYWKITGIRSSDCIGSRPGRRSLLGECEGVRSIISHRNVSCQLSLSFQRAGAAKLLLSNADWLAAALFITSPVFFAGILITSESRLFIYLLFFSLASPTISEGPDWTHYITVLQAAKRPICLLELCPNLLRSWRLSAPAAVQG